MSKQNSELTLLIGMGLSEVFGKNDGKNLMQAIQNLRYDCESKSICKIPLVHIMDTFNVNENSYKIKVRDKILSEKNTDLSKSENTLITEILEDLKQVCTDAKN
jgi:flagellar biosynthesis component FlhA